MMLQVATVVTNVAAALGTTAMDLTPARFKVRFELTSPAMLQ